MPEFKYLDEMLNKPPQSEPQGHVGPWDFPVPKQGGSADDIAARLLREQFEEWEKLFKPIELQQMERISWNNPQVLKEALAEAKESAIGSTNTMAGVAERLNASQGVEATAQQAATANRLTAFNRSLNVAGAQNTARSNQRELDEQILMGAAPNPNVVNSLSSKGLS